MRRYRFRLEPVLRVRRIEEDRARGAYAAAQRAEDDQARRSQAAAVAYEHAVATPPAASDANGFLRQMQHRAAMAEQVVAERNRLAAARVAVEQARLVWADAKAKVGALERLDERKRAEHAAEAVKADDAATDELVTARHGRDR
jgi:flagellar FliJ protein